MKVEVAVLGSPVPNKPHGFCGRKATLNQSISQFLFQCRFTPTETVRSVRDRESPGRPPRLSRSSSQSSEKVEVAVLGFSGGRETTPKNRAQQLCESRCSRSGLPRP